MKGLNTPSLLPVSMENLFFSTGSAATTVRSKNVAAKKRENALADREAFQTLEKRLGRQWN
jgi:hypothetical protein